MVERRQIPTDLEIPIWKLGWRWTLLFWGAIISSVAFVLYGGVFEIIGMLLLIVGPIGALGTLLYVHQNKSTIRTKGANGVMQLVREVVNLDFDRVSTYTLVYDAGDSRLLLPKPKTVINTLVVDDDLLLVHDDAEVNLPRLIGSVGESTTEYYYDHITSVAYNPRGANQLGVFTIKLSDGERRSWKSSRDPSDALEDVQQKLRSFKSNKRDVRTESQLSQQQVKILCPRCEEPVSRNDNFCNNCGKDLS